MYYLGLVRRDGPYEGANHDSRVGDEGPSRFDDYPLQRKLIIITVTSQKSLKTPPNMVCKHAYLTSTVGRCHFVRLLC